MEFTVVIYLVILAAAFFFLIVLPQRRRMAAHQALMASLVVGDAVVTSGGSPRHHPGARRADGRGRDRARGGRDGRPWRDRGQARRPHRRRRGALTRVCPQDALVHRADRRHHVARARAPRSPARTSRSSVSTSRVGSRSCSHPSATSSPDRSTVARDIIDNRVNGLGVAEPEISTQGDNIVVDLPGVKDRDKARRLVGRTAELRFRPVLAELPPVGATPSTTTTTGASSTTVAGAPESTAPTTTTTLSPDQAAIATAVASCDTAKRRGAARRRHQGPEHRPRRRQARQVRHPPGPQWRGRRDACSSSGRRSSPARAWTTRSRGSRRARATPSTCR